MNEYLLKAVIRLFAIVAKGNVTEESRENVKFIVNRQASGQDSEEYMKIFDDFTCQQAEKPPRPNSSIDTETEEFVEEWAKRAEMLQGIETKLFQDAAFIPLHWQNLAWAARKGVNLDPIVNALNFPYLGDLVIH